MIDPIYITGTGVVSAIGIGKAATLEALLNNRSGVGQLKYLKTEHKEFPVGEVKLTDAKMRERLGIAQDAVTTRTALMGMLALGEALDEARLTLEMLPKVGFISGTTVGGMDMSEQYYLDYLNGDAHKEYIAVYDCGSCSEMTAGHFGKFAFATTLATACSSAANAVIQGANMIRCGKADIVVVGGSECITKFHLNGFNSLMILDTKPCRPFDATRSGLNLGEGAAYLVLESAESAKRRGITPQALLSGYGNACDAFHQTASSPDGEGAFRAMKEALDLAGLQPGDIDYINAHGTGHGFLPVNLNWSQPMDNGIVPVAKPEKKALKHILCNAFGFGGNDSSLLLSATAGLRDCETRDTRRIDDQTSRVPHPEVPCQNDIFVLSAKQISMQQPLSEEWMDNPIKYDVPFTRSIDPSFKEYISPIEARRMGRILKRALATSKEALKAAGCDTVDAIMTGTGFGCIENTEFFLDALSNEGEQLLKPTYFMQSTHNTISSLVAIQTKNYNYNATYAHKGISFESALHDAWLQFHLGKIGSALVGCHDEMTETFHSIMKKGGVMGQDDERCGEVAVSVVLSRHCEERSNPETKPLCRLTGLKMLHQPTMNDLMDAVTTMLQSADRSLADVDYILTGISGNHENDKAYLAETKTLFGDKPLLKYKHLFGENFTASGLGFYVAAQCLKAGRVPSHLFVNANEASDKQPACIMLFNRSDGKDFTLTLLER